MFNSNVLWILAAFVVYMGVMIAIGAKYMKSTKNSEDYFLGGRGLSGWVAALSAQASDMSGWLLMGLPGAVYAFGTGQAWIAIGLFIGTVCNWMFISGRLRRYTIRANNSLTLPEYFQNRFHDKKNVLLCISSIVIVVFFLVYTASAFADAVFAKIKTLEPEAKTSDDKFSGVDQGYYLIAETKTGDEGDTYSLVMLDTAGNDSVTVTTKEDRPELEKKVKEKNDSTGAESDWQDAADYDIGDDVPFQLTGTVDAKYDNYGSYYYAFHDTMSDGLTFNADSVTVTVDGTAVTSGYEVVTEDLDDSCTFEVRFADLKNIEAVKAGSKVVVNYTAKLNENAVIGEGGNTNVSKLEYSNNPYGDGTGVTPEDKVIVFTYNLIANKVDGNNAPLEGAGFTLYKLDSTTGDYVAVGNEITGVTTFYFKGVDAGQYKLVETTVPAGYNKADDLVFSVEATYDTTSDNPELKTLVVKDASGKVVSEGTEAIFTATLRTGAVSTDVQNLSGTELPATGGIGTKIFYTVGAIIMIVAAVLLIARKRTAKN